MRLEELSFSQQIWTFFVCLFPTIKIGCGWDLKRGNNKKGRKKTQKTLFCNKKSYKKQFIFSWLMLEVLPMIQTSLYLAPFPSFPIAPFVSKSIQSIRILFTTLIKLTHGTPPLNISDAGLSSLHCPSIASLWKIWGEIHNKSDTHHTSI